MAPCSPEPFMSAIIKAEQLFDLSGQVAFVTGASSGLGARFAAVLAAHGAKVILAARRMERLQKLKAEILAQGGQAEAVLLDLSKPAAVAQAFDRAEAAFGQVNCLINNAGIARPARALDMTAADWHEVLDINLHAVWFAAQEAGRRMAKAK